MPRATREPAVGYFVARGTAVRRTISAVSP